MSVTKISFFDFDRQKLVLLILINGYCNSFVAIELI